MKSSSEIREKFKNRFGSEPELYFAPGRVNLIGEHTDYNEGFVMPAAIDSFCVVAAAKREDRALVVYSEEYEETATAQLESLAATHGHWANYPFGVAWSLQKESIALTGTNLYIASSIPLGAGLSSSAALEVSVGSALIDLANQSMDRTRLALVCQRAENEFVGARCGIMDQFVICHARENCALKIDCRNLSFEALKIPEGMEILVCNTMVKHELAGNEYNERRAQCEEGVRILRKVLPGIRALRDVSVDQLNRHHRLLPEVVYRRCRHVVTEDGRVQRFAAALERGDTHEISRLMAESHRSLRDDYEVSCRELDLMVGIAARQPGVYGARMTGGGFGGCTVNLVNGVDAGQIRENIAREYSSSIGINPDIYVCRAVDGVSKGEPGAAEAREKTAAIKLTAQHAEDHDPQDVPHRRWNPLGRTWILVSPQRMQRPWQGKVDAPQKPVTVAYDPECYLCPGNSRAHGDRNPDYKTTFVFDNDYPALLQATGSTKDPRHPGLLTATAESGICRVICFSPRHDLTISLMSSEAIRVVVDAWMEEFHRLENNEENIGYVQIFENRGALMGASNPHPHCQIWASSSVPDIPAGELESFQDYERQAGSCLLCEYLKIETQKNERLVCENESFAIVVPYWAVWPYETLLISKRHLSDIGQLREDERNHLADILRRITTRYDNLFQAPCPYSMGFHQRPSHRGSCSEFHFHAHYYPPLLRSASVQKFMVGYEMLASPQRDLTAERAAQNLRAASEVHYLSLNREGAQDSVEHSLANTKTHHRNYP